jgi:hypothetical protein
MPRARDLFVDTSGWVYHLVVSKDPLQHSILSGEGEVTERDRKLTHTSV